MALPNQRQKNDVARRMRLPELVALLAVIFFVTAISPACAQAPTAAPSVAGANAQPTVTPAEAGQALDVLQDASRREALIQTLQTIAKTSTPQPSPPLTPSVAPPLVSDGFTAETLCRPRPRSKSSQVKSRRASAQLRNSRSSGAGSSTPLLILKRGICSSVFCGDLRRWRASRSLLNILFAWR